MPMPLLLPSSTCSFSLLILLTNLAILLLLNPQAHCAAWELDLTSSRRLLDTVAGKQKSNIFRANKPAATSSSAEADQQPYFPTEAEFGSGSQRQMGEKEQQRQQQLEQQREEVRFLRDEPVAAEEDGQQTKKQNPFEQTRFDANFPVHNLCGPWNSGRQASDLEWAEPADKLLKLLNTGKHKYNLFMAPGQMTGHATNVSIAMYIESMSSFKAQTMDFEVDMYFAMGWYDRRLAHNCTHPLLITHRPLAERVWTPDLYFLNAKFAYLQEVTTPNFMLIVYPDGLIFKTLRIDVTLSCNMDLQLFPFDKQECPLVIQSFAYIESMLNLSWHVDPPFYPIATNPELKLNDMAITGMRFERCSSPYTMFRGTGVWSCLRGYIVMKRLVLFHLIQTYIPSAMLVSISWMTFWLDPRASPARISLTITSLLTLTTMSNGARQDLPQVSYIKAMDIWQNFSQALIFLVLLEYSFVSYYFTRRTYQCRCSMRRNGAADKRAGWAQKQQKPMFRNATPEDVRLGPASRTSMSSLLNNNVSNNTNGAGRCGITPNHLSCPEGIDSNSNSLRRRRHSAELDQQQQQQPTSAILATAPQLHKNRSKRGRVGRLCVRESVEFEWTGGGMANGSDRPQHWETEDEEAENEGRRQYTDRPCQKCQQLDQRRARAIDRYSRVLFPGIFVTFCALYWLYYWRIMASNTEEQAV